MDIKRIDLLYLLICVILVLVVLELLGVNVAIFD
jgi:hypothetical protein